MSRLTGIDVVQALTTLTGSAQTLLAANEQRQFVQIVNNGANTVYITLDGTVPTVANGIPILANGAATYDGAFVPTGIVKAIGTNGQTVIVVSA